MSSRVKSGDIAGTLRKDGYIVISISKKPYYAHRLAWLFTKGEFPSYVIDHIDGNKSNNSIINLRDVSRKENQQNQISAHAISKSGVLGVHYSNSRKKWIAQISINNKVKYIGEYQDIEMAKKAYLKTKRELHEGNTL